MTELLLCYILRPLVTSSFLGSNTLQSVVLKYQDCSLHSFNSVSIDTRIRAGRPRNRGTIPRITRDILSPVAFRRASDPRHEGCISPEEKHTGRKTDTSLPSSDDVKNAWSYTSTPHKPSRRGA
jgi:hypothetical protein